MISKVNQSEGLGKTLLGDNYLQEMINTRINGMKIRILVYLAMPI